MRDKYTKEVDFYALGCVTFFMLTADLLSTQHNYVPNKTVIENRLRPYKVSQDALEFIMFLITSDRIDNVKGECLEEEEETKENVFLSCPNGEFHYARCYGSGGRSSGEIWGLQEI